MAYDPDTNLRRKIKERLAIYLNCSYDEVTEVKQISIDDLRFKYPHLREDEAEDLIIRQIAFDHRDEDLDYLWHLFNVGHFEEDTLNYKPNKGEEYEIVNSNYLSTIECINSRMRSA